MKTKTQGTIPQSVTRQAGRFSRKLVTSLGVVLVTLASAAPVHAAAWLDETFESYTVGVVPNTTSSPLLMTPVAYSTIVSGNGGKMAEYAKAAAATTGSLQYALSAGLTADGSGGTTRPQGYIAFKILQNTSTVGTIPTTSYLNFRLGAKDTNTLSASAAAFIDLRFLQASTANFKSQVGGATNTTLSISSTAVNTVKIWYNGGSVGTMDYTSPVDGLTKTLAMNTFVVYVNNILGVASATGVTLPTSVTTVASPVTLSTNIGKIAFLSSSANGADFSVDDIYAADSAPTSTVVPVITSATAANGFVGVPFSYTIVADTATSFNVTGLPGELTFNATTGVISGTPLSLSPVNAVLTATNAVGTSLPVNLAITVSPPLNTFSGSDPSMNNSVSWSLGQSPTSSSNTIGSFQNLALASSATSLTTISANIYAKTWNITNGSSYDVSSLASVTTAFRMGNNNSVADTSPFDNAVSGVQNDLVYLSGGSDLTFSPANPTLGSTPSTVELRNSGNLNIGSGSILDIQTVITDNSSRALTKTGVGTAILSGANSYRGGTTVSAGTLTVAGTASPAVTARATSTISLGQVTAITIVDGGSGYTVAPAVTIAKGTGEGTVTTATATAIITGGVVTGITIVTPGANYTVEPLIQIASNQSPLGNGAVTLAGGTLNATVDADLGRITPYAPTGSAGAYYRINGLTTTLNAASTITVADTKTLTSYTVAGNSNSANLITKNGLGTLWLRGGGAATVQGGWSIDAGTLFVGTSSSTGLGTGTLTMNGGNLRFSKGISSTGTYTGQGQDIPLAVLQDTTITLDANPLSPSGSNTVSFPSLDIGTKTIHLIKSATAKSSADDIAYADPLMTFQSATLSGIATMDVGALTQMSLQAASGSGAGITKTGTGRMALGDNLTGATATATQSGGSVDSLTVTAGGSGYVAAPTVTISAPVSGITATATATLTGDVVTGLTITNGGSGYTTTPAVTFSAPKNGVASSYTGATTISAGTLALSGSHASPITLSGISVLEITLDELGLAMATSTSSLTLISGSKVRIVGTPVSASYTLVSASSITGTPVLETAIPGYSLSVAGGSLILTTTPALPPFETWATGAPYNLTGSNALASADPDNDGLKNALEFVLGGNPTGNDSPSIRPVMVNGTTAVTLTFSRSDASELAPATTVKVQVSADLATWNSADDITIGSIDGTGPNGVTYTVAENAGAADTIVVSIPKNSATRKFARVEAVVP